jgi:FlaA1/EpsC-like NDP-sugar epimerase
MLRLGDVVEFDRPLAIFIGFEILCVLTVFISGGVYRNMFRFSGAKGLAKMLRFCLIIAVLTVVCFGFISMPGVPRTVSVIFPLMFFMLVALSRIVARFILVEIFEGGSERKRVLIYGAGTAGRRLGLSIEHDAAYHLVAYTDDDPALAGKRIEWVPILPPAAAHGMLSRGEIDLVLLAMPQLSHSQRAKVMTRLQVHGVHVQTLPSLDDIVAGQVSISDLREIEMIDLLARDPVMPDAKLMIQAITGKVVMVTGAGGSIGGELCRQILSQRPQRLVLFEMSEAALFEIDVELRAISEEQSIACEIVAELATLVNPHAVARAFSRWRPNTVYHAAAYKHVPLVEANALSGVRNNVLGTLYAAQCAREFGAERFVLVSTDKAVRPTNIMGASKRVCELILQALAREQQATPPIYSMVRFGNVLGSSGSVVPHFKRQIAASGPVTLTHREMTRFFMTIPEAAELVIQAGAMAKGGEVYLLDMGKAVRIYDLARSMIQMSGRSVRDEHNPCGDIEIVEVGLRPGEKLFEELLIDAEAVPTEHVRIFCARENYVPWCELEVCLSEIENATVRGDEEAIRAQLSRLVSGFNPPWERSASVAPVTSVASRVG